MMIGTISDRVEEVGYAPVIRKALDYLRSADLSEMGPGTYPIEGESMFVMIQEPVTEAKESRKPESHRRYIDIQYLLEGEERILVTRRSGKEAVTEDLLDAKDVMFYGDLSHDVDIVLQPGMYAVFFPSDIHRPCCSVRTDMPIRKAVVKISVDLL